MKKYLIIPHIKQLCTLKGCNDLRKGQAMNNVELLQDAYLVIKDGKFYEIGTGASYEKYLEEATLVKPNGALVTPGLIDSHTHLVHAGSRENELKMKLSGKTYLEILNEGGGIHHTVKKTRKASFAELYEQAYRSLDLMLLHGTTVVEAKSGYGLDFTNEKKQLEVAKKLNQDHPIEIINTFMGAHAIPREYEMRRDEFIQLLKEMMEKVKALDLAQFCDVFCEEGVFSLSETKELLLYAKALGFGLKMHADEIAPMGGARLASELGARSADHLMATKSEDLKILASSQTLANILPLTSFYLNQDFAKTKEMIESGCGLAIATDYNPGSSPSENLQLAMQIASLKTQMTPEEVLTAVTINGAYSLGLEQRKGSIEVGKDADFVIFDCPNLNYLIYHFGINHVKDVYIQGKRIINNGRKER